jgi:FAD/FMN-containing dehydrogenase
VPGLRAPLTHPAPWNLLIELSDRSDDAQLQAKLEQVLTQAGELITDAALASNQAQCEQFWRIRSSVSEGNKKSGMSLVFDVAVPLVRVPQFIARAEAAVRLLCPEVRVPVVGHLGDGNMHLVIVIGWAHWQSLSDPQALLQTMRDAVYAIVAELGGTWSAEHGIGRMLLKEMKQYKSSVELNLMRTIKTTLDPQGLFNPGKVLPA